MLTLLQAVLGFDNLLYVSLESKRVDPDRRSFVRKWGIGLAIVFRIGLLFALIAAIESFQKPFLHIDLGVAIDGELNVHALIVLLGGAFIVYTAFKEIVHLLSVEELEATAAKKKPRSVQAALFWIILMNLVFSFDSILSAIALTKVFVVMAAAIVVSGVGMIWLADRVSAFLQANRMFEVLGLFILFLVGVMLLSEGGHLAHLHLFGYVVEPMAKSTFYFVLAVLVVIDVVQSKYRKKLMAMAEAGKGE
ncbi:MAG: tellurium resistance protein TerC [Planctomycetes bacterium]|nr:tellurium resistance protein TerC [Planctomycetota bacterium]